MNQEKAKGRPVIVCLHGSASNSAMWREFRSAVRERATVITPDLHSDDSHAPGEGHRHALQAEADTVLEAVGKTDGPFHLVAHSRGGAVAACIANRCPERVASIVCYEPAGIAEIMARGLNVPVQVLCGTRSWPAAKRIAEKTTGLVAQARLLKLVGLRHMAPVTHPHVVNPIILDYVLPVSMPEQVRAA